ncbi:hypothetical protein CYY_006484 [Polysphondylium violaceum]|uniref:malate synthase n=1 Tax=Polysphondylium violaceum TaxID=133409 RepID=A0A8J4PRA5_9MYCE|nr:hypothetical protein CYY_006484 [Polysphondylium violaceum]
MNKWKQTLLQNRIEILASENLNRLYTDVISEDALKFVATLHREFEGQRRRLMEDRIRVQASIVDSLDFVLVQDPKTFEIRQDPHWTITHEIPAVIADRKVDIVCLDVANRDALNACVKSGACGVQVDFDDGYAPTWENGLRAQKNIYDVVQGGQQQQGKDALLIMRPRSWNLIEMHMLVDGQPVSGGLFDYGLFMYLNAKQLIKTNRGPFFYIPKLENYQEAQLWNRIFMFTEQHLGLPTKSIKCIVLIENILAAYQMEEIIYYLRDYIVALNTGRWDYIFSFIKKFSDSPDHVFPNKSSLGLDQEFLQAYYHLLVKTSHRRGCLATGGMAPQYPTANQSSLCEKDKLAVFNGKSIEAAMGFDGGLVAHPSSVDACRKAFDKVIGQNRLNNLQTSSNNKKKNSNSNSSNNRLLGYSPIEAKKYLDQLIVMPKGIVTEQDVRGCVYVLYNYISHWIKGQGAVPMNGVVEDLATAEINRALLWNWIKNNVELNESTDKKVTIQLILNLIKHQFFYNNNNNNDFNNDPITKILLTLITSQSFIDFMPTILYPLITNIQINSNL